MTTQEINKELHLLLGKCWHKWIPPARPKSFFDECVCEKCQKKALYPFHAYPYPNYCADPREVIKAMMEREDWIAFREYITSWYSILDLIMDTIGKLALLAIEWLRREGERCNDHTRNQPRIA